jgi:hypothetical protein
MYCPSCAHQNSDGAAVCAACGQSLALLPVPRLTAPPQPAAARRLSGTAVAGLVLAFFCAPLGLVFSIIGYSECKRSPETVEGLGLAIGGLVLASVQLVLALIAIAAWGAIVKSIFF